MIESLTLKNIATYDPIDGVQIPDLKRVNFFFGYNGSGKSTIVKYLYNLSLEENLKAQQYNDCSQIGYDETIHQIIVFDENFTEVNFNRNPVLKGVFSLNQTNAIIDGQIATEETSINEYNELIRKKSIIFENVDTDKRQNQNALLEHCKETYLQRLQKSI
jgi:predicted ATPase